jgi:hypothetical protein
MIDALVALQQRVSAGDRGVTCKHVHTALTEARKARARFVELTAVIDLAKELPSLTALIRPFSDEAKRFDDLQQQLRDATALDDALIVRRDAVRAALIRSAVPVIDASARVIELRRLLNRGKTALAEWPRDEAATPAGGVFENDDQRWVDSLRTRAQVHATFTEEYVRQLTAALGSFAAALAPNDDGVASQHATVLMEQSVLASVAESAGLAEARMSWGAAAAFEHRLGAFSTLAAAAASMVARARHVRAVEAPSDNRLQRAQSRLRLACRQVALTTTALAHPINDDDDPRELQATLLLSKSERSAAMKEEAAAVIELGAALHDFPELALRFPRARLDVLAQGVVGGVDDATSALRTLDAYDERVKIAGTRHIVERASIGGEVCALKLFTLSERGQRAFLKEARQLRQLTHPNVVQLRAAFVDGLMGVIEMPLYEHGSLWAWLATAARNEVDKIGVLRQTLCGLEHVHRMGVVHGDVKPDNVFVDAEGVAKLGDFDVSHDDDAVLTLTRVGVTVAYGAPELLTPSAPKPSKASDVFAFGLTVFDIIHGVQQPLVRPVDTARLAAAELVGVRELVDAMIAPDPSDRSTASRALALGAFAPPAPGRDPAVDRRSCTICFDHFWANDGLECGAAHFVCVACTEGCVRSVVEKPIAHVAPLCCPVSQCGREIGHARLAASIAEAVFVAYIEKLNEAQESRVNHEWQLRMYAELLTQSRLLRGELTREERIGAHRRHVCDNLLTMHCPQCRAAFVDFSDCFALECAMCGAEFCAWCLANCGDTNSAHTHVLHCKNNITNPRSVFGSERQFEDCHRQRRERLVREYLQAIVQAEMRGDVLAALAEDLAGVGVVIE